MAINDKDERPYWRQRYEPRQGNWRRLLDDSLIAFAVAPLIAAVAAWTFVASGTHKSDTTQPASRELIETAARAEGGASGANRLPKKR